MNPLQSSIQPCLVVAFAIIMSTIPVLAQEKGKTNKKKKGLQIPEGVEVIRDLKYAKNGIARQKLDLYLPKNRGDKKLPVVLWIHGGGWLNGSKDKCKAAFLATKGFAVASVGYRLTDQAQWPGQIDDLYTAVHWLRVHGKNYQLDGDHIGAWGSSAGGHLAALLGTRKYTGLEEVSSRVQAVCDWFGPTDLLIMPPNVVSEKRTLEQVSKSNGAKLLGKTVRDVPELAKDASAFYQIDERDPPFLIMHGSEDPGVPLEQSRKFHDALQAAGVESEFVIVEGAGHGGAEFNTGEVQEKVRAFFAKHLQK